MLYPRLSEKEQFGRKEKKFIHMSEEIVWLKEEAER